MTINEIKIIINRLQHEKHNFDVIGVRYENTYYVALEEAIDVMYKLAKEIK